MTVVDLVKARAFANFYAEDDASQVQLEAAEWIAALADEVESLQRALNLARESEQAALADAAHASAERDEALKALTEILATINKIMPRV